MKPPAPAAPVQTSAQPGGPPGPRPDPLRDLVAFFHGLQAVELPPHLALLALRYGRTVELLVDRLMRGERPNLHKMLGLPDRCRSSERRRLFLLERNRAVRELAAALPRRYSSWKRAALIGELLAEGCREPGPATARGTLATLRDGLLGTLPSHPRSYFRILRGDH